MKLSTLFLLALALLMIAGCQAQPNLLLITVDTVRADHCSLYGYERDTTPVLRRLSKGGATYRQAEAPASFTMGSVGSIMTGLYPGDHGADAHPSMLRSGCETIAEVLRAKGFETTALVTNPILKKEFGFSQGFETYRLVNMQLRKGRPVSRAAEETTSLAISLLESQRSPFFLWVHYMDPHWWYEPPAPYRTRYSPENKEWTQVVNGTFDGSVPVGDVYFHPSYSAAARQRAVDLYDGEITYVDHEIGRLVARLEALGLRKSTLIVITSDHGESLGEHGIQFCHGFFTYEDNLRVPLLLLPPGAPKPPVQVDGPFSLVDLKALMLHRMGWGPPPAARRFLLAESEPLYGDRHIRGNIPGRPRAYVEGKAGKWRSIREGRFKLIAIPHADRLETEFYDLSRDPTEQRDLTESRGDVRRRLLSRLEDLVPEMGGGRR